MIPEDDWHNLCQQWEMNPAKGIRAEVELGNLSTDISRKNTVEGEGLEPHFEETNLLDACNGRKSEVILISDDDDRGIKFENVPFLRTTPEVSSFLQHSLQHEVIMVFGIYSHIVHKVNNVELRIVRRYALDLSGDLCRI